MTQEEKCKVENCNNKAGITGYCNGCIMLPKSWDKKDEDLK